MDIVNQIAETLTQLLPYFLVGLLLLCVSGVIIYIITKLIVLYRYKQETRYYFEVIPPASSAIEAEATTELFKVLHGIDQTRSRRDRMTGRHVRISLEIVANKHDGIRYIIGAPLAIAPIVEQEVRSYIADAKTAQVEDPYKSRVAGNAMVPMEFRQKRHFALPLTSKVRLQQHDPLAYLTGTMTSLQENESIIYQLTIIPRSVPEAQVVASQVLTNEDVLARLMNDKRNTVQELMGFINSILFSILDSIGGLSAQSSSLRMGSSTAIDPLTMHSRQVAMHLRPTRVLSSFEQEAVELIHNKVSEPLFQTSVRTVMASTLKNRAKQRSRSLRTSLTSFSTIQYQSLISRPTMLNFMQTPFRLALQKNRLPSVFMRSSLILSTSEISALFHFPYAGTNRTENIVKSLSRALPAPLSLKNNPILDVLIGENVYHGTTTPIGLTEKERERHMYVIGGTGNGKTTMLQYMIIQDIQNGKGLAVIDPHGDMALEIISRIPGKRITDVIYFNPDDLSYPIGLNLLELDETLEGDDLLREKDLITESVVSIFRKIFSDDDSGGHRIEYILRNATQTALTVKDATLFTIYNLLNDGKYRRKITAKLTDENLQKFWRNEFGKAGNFQQVKMAAGITAKVGRFLFSASAKRILEQPKSTIDFDSIMNDGKILICNFSKGLLGEDTSELLGTAVIAKLQLASLRRARISQTERVPFYLYVDEFQNFATVSFVQMLSESRKYRLFLTMAEQSTSQQTDKDMVNIILANVGTVITFRTGNPADEKLLLPLFNPYLDDGEIMNLASFNFYMRLAAIHSQEPLSGITILTEDGRDSNIFKKVIASSRELYANKNRIEFDSTTNSTPKKDTIDAKSKSPVTTSAEEMTPTA